MLPNLYRWSIPCCWELYTTLFSGTSLFQFCFFSIRSSLGFYHLPLLSSFYTSLPGWWVHSQVFNHHAYTDDFQGIPAGQTYFFFSGYTSRLFIYWAIYIFKCIYLSIYVSLRAILHCSKDRLISVFQSQLNIFPSRPVALTFSISKKDSAQFPNPESRPLHWLPLRILRGDSRARVPTNSIASSSCPYLLLNLLIHHFLDFLKSWMASISFLTHLSSILQPN